MEDKERIVLCSPVCGILSISLYALVCRYHYSHVTTTSRNCGWVKPNPKKENGVFRPQKRLDNGKKVRLEAASLFHRLGSFIYSYSHILLDDIELIQSLMQIDAMLGVNAHHFFYDN